MTQPLRFIHASDFHLDRPVTGIAETSDALRPVLIDAPFRAAQTVCDVALDRRVDFVVLTGNLLDPCAAGPRGLAFLVEQFERLDAAGIVVYWLSGETDAPEHWPAAIELPANVRHVDSGRGEYTLHWREGKAIARIGPLAALPLRREADEKIFTVGLSHGTPRLSALEAPFDYLALGGRFAREIVHSGSPWVVCAGSPQGRSIQHTGPHGCTLVEVDADGHVRVALRTCDAVRWREEQIPLDECRNRAQWETVLRDRLAAATAEAGDRPILLNLKLIAGASHVSRTERERLAAEMLTWLRETYATATNPVWTVGIDHEPATQTDDAQEQDTILGEFLRTIDQLRTHPDDGLRLTDYIAPSTLTDDLAARLNFATPERRNPLLTQVSELGRNLLGSANP